MSKDEKHNKRNLFTNAYIRKRKNSRDSSTTFLISLLIKKEIFLFTNTYQFVLNINLQFNGKVK